MDLLNILEKKVKRQHFLNRKNKIKLQQPYYNGIIENQKKNKSTKAAFQRCFYTKAF